MASSQRRQTRERCRRRPGQAALRVRRLYLGRPRWGALGGTRLEGWCQHAIQIKSLAAGKMGMGTREVGDLIAKLVS